MPDKQQPEPLRLAALIEKTGARGSLRDQAAAELRRQYAENDALRTGYEAARLEIESLQSQLHAAKQINAAQFGLLTSSMPSSALRAFEGLPAAQEPLGVEFERVLHDNLFDLYEESPQTASHGQAPAQPARLQEAQERVYLVATGETLNGRELYERHEKYVPLADCETLYTAPQPSPAAQGDALDAARYRWLAASCRSTSEHWGGRWSIIIDGPAPKSHDSEDDFDAAIDAARAAQEGK